MEGDLIHVQMNDNTLITVTETNRGECRSCGEPVIWCLTGKGKRMPVDEPEDDGRPTFSHFATCPQAEDWRKKRGAGA